nr:immunoglobulin heavy chain junction region [Macaca mulatta]MOV88987.1 immunoglobulin heavy chain junction region [Macaca mulatta]
CVSGRWGAPDYW